MKVSKLGKNPFAKRLLTSAWAAGLLLGLQVPEARSQQQCAITNKPKFYMPPNLDTGTDVLDSHRVALADDFLCTNTGPVTDIHLWGSWLTNNVGFVTNFWLGIYDDVPAVTNAASGQIAPSHPGTNLLWSQDFGPADYSYSPSGTGNECFYNPGNNVVLGSDNQAFFYCFYPTNPFVQQGTATQPTNYWLAVTAQLYDSNTWFGWKTSISNYNDGAVWIPALGGKPLPGASWTPITNYCQIPGSYPVDLSFVLTTSATNPPPTVCVETNGVKYVQMPNLYFGYDVWDSSSRPPQATDGPWVCGDDFVCTNTGPITDIHLWGSWQNDQPLPGSITFWLGVFDDVPTNAANSFSHPGTNLLWNQWFAPPDYAETIYTNNAYESFLDPGPPPMNLGPESQVWYYCFYPSNLFQYGSTAAPSNYWLVAFAQLPTGVTNVWGWKTTTNYQHDISVHAPWTGTPPTNNPPWIPTIDPQGVPLDLAFKLTTPTNQCTTPPQLLCSNISVGCGMAWSPPVPGIYDPCCQTNGKPVLVGAVTNGNCPVVVQYFWQYTNCMGQTASCVGTVTVTSSPPVLQCSNVSITCGSPVPTNPPPVMDSCCSNVTVTLLGITTNDYGCGKVIYETWLAVDCCTNRAVCTQVINVTPPPGSGVVVPNTNATAAGGYDNTYPFDITYSGIANQRYQQVYAASQFGAVPSGGAYITALAFRRAAGWSGFDTTLPAVQIDLSTTANGPDGLSSTFANNVGGDDTVVFNGALTLASSDMGSPPAFDIVIPLTTPFFYNPAAGNLLLDVRNSGGGTTAPFDAVDVVGDSVSRAYGGVGSSLGSTDTIGLVTKFTLGPPLQLVCSNLTIPCGSPIPTNPPSVTALCCSNVSLTLVNTITNVQGCYQFLYQNWQAVDCCNNQTNCTRQVAVLPSGPNLLCSNLTIFCNDPLPAPPGYIDACCTNVTVILIRSDTNSYNCSNVIFQTWMATDNCCSNSTTCTRSVTVIAPPPTIYGCSNLVVATCNSNVQVFWPLIASSPCGIVTVTSTPPSGTYFLPNTTNVVVITAWDQCGHTNTCTFTVTVVRPVLGPLTITYSAPNITLHWTAGILEQSSSLLGPWSDVPSASPPTYTVAASAAATFYRLRCNSP